MTLLLDTHAFLWFCQGDPSLRASTKNLIEDPANVKVLSIANCWEIAIKTGSGKLKLGEPAVTYIPNALAATGIGVLVIMIAHATAVETLPSHHRDPFDRLLIAQSTIESMPIVSVDPVFDQYGVTRLW